jgi:hypothetical protein
MRSMRSMYSANIDQWTMFYVQCSIIESAFSQAWWVTSEAGEGGRAGEEEKEKTQSERSWTRGLGFTAPTGGVQPTHAPEALARLAEFRVKVAADMQLSKFSFPPTLLGTTSTDLLQPASPQLRPSTPRSTAHAGEV